MHAAWGQTIPVFGNDQRYLFLLTMLHADDNTTVWCMPPAPMDSEGPSSALVM